jgi:hypothetical protein
MFMRPKNAESRGGHDQTFRFCYTMTQRVTPRPSSELRARNPQLTSHGWNGALGTEAYLSLGRQVRADIVIQCD